jgi:hypothetical protein
MIDVTWIVVVGSAVLLLELKLTTLLPLLKSDVSDKIEAVLTGSAALLLSGMTVLDANSDVELLLGVGADVLQNV